MFQSWINGILGLWMILTGFISGVQTSVNFIVVGAVIAILGFWGARKWQNDVSAVLGLWFVLSGIITSLISPVNSIIVGIIVAALSFWAATTSGEEMMHKTV